MCPFLCGAHAQSAPCGQDGAAPLTGCAAAGALAHWTRATSSSLFAGHSTFTATTRQRTKTRRNSDGHNVFRLAGLVRLLRNEALQANANARAKQQNAHAKPIGRRDTRMNVANCLATKAEEDQQQEEEEEHQDVVETSRQAAAAAATH